MTDDIPNMIKSCGNVFSDLNVKHASLIRDTIDRIRTIEDTKIQDELLSLLQKDCDEFIFKLDTLKRLIVLGRTTLEK